MPANPGWLAEAIAATLRSAQATLAELRGGARGQAASVKAVDWDRVVQLQGELLRGSLDRSAQLTQRYLEVTQAVVTAIASATQQARKAA